MKASVEQLLKDPARLERELVGLGLHDLLAQLGSSPLPSPPEGTSRVRDLFGPSLPGVLAGGLGRMPRNLLESLLHDPELVLELQELVLCEGGDYWQRLVPPGEGIVPPDLKPVLRPTPEPVREPSARLAGKAKGLLLAAVFLALAWLGVVAARYHAEEVRRQEQEVAALREQLRRVDREQVTHRLPPSETAEQRLPLLCKALSALSGLPPDEARDVPRGETCLSLPDSEPGLGDEGPGDRAFLLLLDSVRADEEAMADLRAHPRRYLKHEDPAVRHGALLVLEHLQRTRAPLPPEGDRSW